MQFSTTCSLSKSARLCGIISPSLLVSNGTFSFVSLRAFSGIRGLAGTTTGAKKQLLQVAMYLSAPPITSTWNREEFFNLEAMNSWVCRIFKKKTHPIGWKMFIKRNQPEWEFDFYSNREFRIRKIHNFSALPLRCCLNAAP